MHATIVHVSIRDEQAHEAASMYYLQGHTMENIAHHLGISRSSISRLLAHARETGLVRISVAAAPGTRGTLAGQISELFGVQTSVVPVREVDTDVNRLHNVALVAAERLVEMMKPGATLAVAWGNTTSEVTRNLPRVHFPGSTVVQLNGAFNATKSGLPYADSIMTQAANAFGSRVVHFPVPAFFDYPQTRDAMWQERSIRSVLDTIDNADVALFGVGSLTGNLPSHVYASGYLDPEDIRTAQADGVVGDVCTVLIREDGSTNMPLNERASGPTPHTLQKIPRRLCVVSGGAKALPLLGALRAKVATDLVLDDSAARALLDLVRQRTQNAKVLQRKR